MPRITNQLYYQRHCFLSKAWTDFQILYALLPTTLQWQVHAYYRPTAKLDYDELLQHRQSITRENPSLPASAGKAFNRMYAVFQLAFEHAQGNERQLQTSLRYLVGTTATATVDDRGRMVSILGIARPEPDLERLARALLAQVRDAHKADVEESSAPDNDS